MGVVLYLLAELCLCLLYRCGLPLTTSSSRPCLTCPHWLRTKSLVRLTTCSPTSGSPASNSTWWVDRLTAMLLTYMHFGICVAGLVTMEATKGRTLTDWMFLCSMCVNVSSGWNNLPHQFPGLRILWLSLLDHVEVAYVRMHRFFIGVAWDRGSQESVPSSVYPGVGIR